MLNSYFSTTGLGQPSYNIPTAYNNALQYLGHFEPTTQQNFGPSAPYNYFGDQHFYGGHMTQPRAHHRINEALAQLYGDQNIARINFQTMMRAHQKNNDSILLNDLQQSNQSPLEFIPKEWMQTDFYDETKNDLYNLWMSQKNTETNSSNDTTSKRHSNQTLPSEWSGSATTSMTSTQSTQQQPTTTDESHQSQSQSQNQTSGSRNPGAWVTFNQL